mgnify:FL=1
MKAAIVTSLIGASARTTMEPSVAPHSSKTSSWAREASLVVAAAPGHKHVTVQLKVDAAAQRTLETVFWAVSDPDH